MKSSIIDKIVKLEGKLSKHKALKKLRKLGYGRNMSKELFNIISRKHEAERAVALRAKELGLKQKDWMLTRSEFLSVKYKHKEYSLTQCFRDHRRIVNDAYINGKPVPWIVLADYIR